MTRKLIILIGLISISSFTSFGQIVINSQYEPFSYEEIMAPVQAVANFQNQCCKTLIELIENARLIEPYINNEKDPITWGRYINYYNSVVNEYNRIQDNGTNMGTRKRISDLQIKYSKVIKGIKIAYNRRNELANNQYQRIRATNEKCDRWYSEISLDEFLDGRTPAISYY